MRKTEDKVCRQCGSPVRGGGRYCPHCGCLQTEDLDGLIVHMRENVRACRRQYEHMENMRAEGGRARAGIVDAGVYASPAGGYPRSEEHPRVPAGARGSMRAPSRNRIFISCLCAALLLLSLGLCFAPWLNGEGAFTGLEAALGLFGSGYGASFSQYMEGIAEKVFFGSELITSVCRAFCRQVLRIGVPAYILSLLLGMPVFLSAFGKVRLAGWHRCFAWTAFLVSVLLMLVFLWVSGAESVSVWFILGGTANLVRGVLLIFYDNRPRFWGGLER